MEKPEQVKTKQELKSLDEYLAIIEWGWVSSEELWRSRNVLSAEAINTLWDLHNPSDNTKAEFNSSMFSACLSGRLEDKGLFRSAHILQIADVVLRVVFLLYLLCF